jgi:hypothetical protein
MGTTNQKTNSFMSNCFGKKTLSNEAIVFLGLSVFIIGFSVVVIGFIVEVFHDQVIGCLIFWSGVFLEILAVLVLLSLIRH